MPQANAVNVMLPGPGGETVTAVGEQVQFSAFRCFPMTGTDAERAILRRLGLELVMRSRGLALYRSGPFLEFLVASFPAQVGKLRAIVDPAGQALPDCLPPELPVVASADALPADVDTIFVCETRTEIRWRIERAIPERLRVVSPDDAKKFVELIPLEAWIPTLPCIYPIPTPDIDVRPGLDFLLLELPARGGVQIPVGLSYVHTALKRSRKLAFQTIDANMIYYHRFHIQRLFDLGTDPILRNGRPLTADPFDYNERAWIDPRQWAFLLDYFSEVTDELVEKIIAARPKVVGMSIHQRNEWLSRAVARRLKAEAPDIVIVAGGHSCYSDHFGRGAFPEHDYMVIGEGDLVVGPLAEALARGERPRNLPGVISPLDDPAKPFMPGPQPHNLDMLGGITTEFFENWNQIYTSWHAFQSTALPLTRGCVWSRCSFCAERFAFRTRSAVNYVDEMEYFLNAGRLPAFQASDSDFGGRPETLYEICEEILKRGLKLQFGGQIRLNKKFNLDFFKTMRAAGVIGLNFGADALTDNMIKQQMKGYTLDMLLQNHRDCAAAGITPQINLVIGAPGETDQDLVDTINLLKDNRDCFPLVSNINACMLVQNSVYWWDPAKFNIFFHGDKDEIYKTYYFGVPSRLWYSTEPYIDRSVRADRFMRLYNSLSANNIAFGPDVQENMRDLMAGTGHIDYREMALDPNVLIDVARIGTPKIPVPKPGGGPMGKRVHLRHNGCVLAFDYDPRLLDILGGAGVEFWTTTGPGTA